MANSVPFSFQVLDFVESYRRCKKHAIELQWVEGTQRLALPVSRTTEKV
jgi:hypothetical protein